jgi:hypothetical protein
MILVKSSFLIFNAHQNMKKQGKILISRIQELINHGINWTIKPSQIKLDC